MRRSKAIVLFSILTCLWPMGWAKAQNEPGSLQLGFPIENKIAPGQTHRFSVSLEQDQFAQLVVDQHGIDVVVRVFSPAGKSLGTFDSPNGTEGPENVSLVANSPGVYRIEVTPLDQSENAKPGRYEIKIIELRAATEQELQAGGNQEALKAKGFALLLEATENLQEIRLPQTRLRVQIKVAQLLWTTDEKHANNLIGDAIEGIKEYLATVDVGGPDYYQTYQEAMQLRQEVIQTLAPHDPDRALTFLRSTRTLVNPDGGQQNGQPNQELELELYLASQITATDPKHALEIAEDSLKRGYSPSLVDTLTHLRTADPEAAAKLAKDIAAKLMDEKLLRNPQAGNLAVNLLQLARPPARKNQTSDTNAAGANIALLSEQEYQELFRKTLSEGLASPSRNPSSIERNSAQTILSSLEPMRSDIEGYAPGSTATVEKRTTEFITNDPQVAVWQKFQKAIQSGSLDTALEAVTKAPPEMRDQLYQQVAAGAAVAGDFTGARQIITNHLSNPFQRRQALNNLEQQAIYSAIAKGKIEDALRSLGNLPVKERANMISQIANQIGPGRKRATALNLLELARSMLGTSVQAENQEQMNALFEIGRAFSRYDSKRGFEIVEPLLDQFNEICAAAVTLNGFGQQYYQDGGLIFQNGNSVANIANQLTQTLGSMALGNFDRAKTAADRIRAPEARLGAYLAIAEQTIQEPK